MADTSQEAILAAARALKGKKVKALEARPDHTVTGELLDFSEDGGVLLRHGNGRTGWYWPLLPPEEVRDA